MKLNRCIDYHGKGSTFGYHKNNFPLFIEIRILKAFLRIYLRVEKVTSSNERITSSKKIRIYIF